MVSKDKTKEYVRLEFVIKDIDYLRALLMTRKNELDRSYESVAVDEWFIRCHKSQTIQSSANRSFFSSK